MISTVTDSRLHVQGHGRMICWTPDVEGWYFQSISGLAGNWGSQSATYIDQQWRQRKTKRCVSAYLHFCRTIFPVNVTVVTALFQGMPILDSQISCNLRWKPVERRRTIERLLRLLCWVLIRLLHRCLQPSVRLTDIMIWTSCQSILMVMRIDLFSQWSLTFNSKLFSDWAPSRTLFTVCLLKEVDLEDCKRFYDFSSEVSGSGRSDSSSTSPEGLNLEWSIWVSASWILFAYLIIRDVEIFSVDASVSISGFCVSLIALWILDASFKQSLADSLLQWSIFSILSLRKTIKSSTSQSSTALMSFLYHHPGLNWPLYSGRPNANSNMTSSSDHISTVAEYAEPFQISDAQ